MMDYFVKLRFFTEVKSIFSSSFNYDNLFSLIAEILILRLFNPEVLFKNRSQGCLGGLVG